MPSAPWFFARQSLGPRCESSVLQSRGRVQAHVDEYDGELTIEPHPSKSVGLGIAATNQLHGDGLGRACAGFFIGSDEYKLYVRELQFNFNGR